MVMPARFMAPPTPASPILRYSSGGIIVGYNNILSAVADLSAGNGLELRAGTYALGNTNMVLPKRVTLVGAGMAGEGSFGNLSNMGGSIITWSGSLFVQGPGVVPGDYNSISNLSIVGDGNNSSQTPFGTVNNGTINQQGGVGVVVSNVYIYGNIDCVYAVQNTAKLPTQYDFFNCIFEGGFDAFNAGNSANTTLTQVNCISTINAAYNPGSGQCRCISSSGASVVEAYGGKMSIQDNGGLGGGTANYIAHSSGTAGIVRVFNVALGFPADVTNILNDPFHMKQQSTGLLYHAGCFDIANNALLISGNAQPLVSSSDPCPTTKNPKDATAANRPKAPAAGVTCFYSGKLYVCTDAATPTWELVTSA